MFADFFLPTSTYTMGAINRVRMKLDLGKLTRQLSGYLVTRVQQGGIRLFLL